MNRIRCIDRAEADQRLAKLGASLGAWNEISFGDSKTGDEPWVSFRAPKHANELLSFSLNVVAWLPRGDWKLFQIDNSSWLDFVDRSLIAGILGWSIARDICSSDKRTILFESSPVSNDRTEDFLIAQLIFTFLMREQHAYVVSAGGEDRQVLGIQDGFVYFYAATSKQIDNARALLKRFEEDDAKYPDWVIELIAIEQEDGRASG